jgi:superfamily I DNA/RNA helicase
MVLQKQHVTSWDAYKSVVREGRKDALPVAKREAVWEALKKYESYQQYTKQYTYDEVIFQLNKYIERWPEYKPFSHIICDEVQDFSNLELRLMRNLVEEKPNDLFLSGDPFQNIYQRKISFSKSGINIRGVRSHRLRVNYRTTEEIRQFAVQMLATHQYEDFSAGAASFKGDTSILHGEQPQYITFENETKASTFIIDFIKGSFGEIGLHELCLTARTMDQVEALQTQLQAAKIPAIKLADVSELSQVQHRVVLSTMHGLKGLEFKYLLVAGFDQSSFPYWPSGYKKWAAKDQQAYNKAEHALFYVVFSRAISKLIVTGIGAPVELGEWGD